jgi:mannose-6-phosphate isomerase-like protein (cupin superfamily)
MADPNLHRIEHEADLAVVQPGPHGGTGSTIAHSFFADAQGLDLVVRKRILHPGASIGMHCNRSDEIYYVLAGQGEIDLDGELQPLGPGSAALTRAGGRHGLRQVGAGDLVVMVVYRRDGSAPS